MKNKKVFTVYIGENDIYEWSMNEGKDVLMPQIFKGVKKVYSKELDEIHVARVETSIRGQKKAFDFWVKDDEIEDTIDKLMEWSLESENYELCSEIKKLIDSAK